MKMSGPFPVRRGIDGAKRLTTPLDVDELHSAATQFLIRRMNNAHCDQAGLSPAGNHCTACDGNLEPRIRPET